MKNGVLKLGFAPTRRVLTTPKAFNKDEARRIKDCIEAEIRTYPMLELVTLDTINDEGLLFDVADAEKAAALFLREQVDAVFIPHCNFGSEEAVAKLARAVGKPVLIWGPRDAAPDANGDRLTDTQCGMFATTKVLQQFGVKFTYITNCALSDPKFREGFDTFLRAASVVKAMRHLRIGQIGTRPEIFWSVKVNERELMEKFGIEIVPITMTDLSNLLLAHEKAHSDLVQAEAASLKTRFPKSGYSDDAWTRLANLKLTLRAWAEEKQVSAIAAQCWRPMDTVAGVAPCFVFSELTGEGLPVICESDIHGAVSSVIAAAASRYQSATFLADLTIRHPTNDNAELLWHCGVFPHVLAKQETANVALHFNRRNPAVGSWELKHGDHHCPVRRAWRRVLLSVRRGQRHRRPENLRHLSLGRGGKLAAVGAQDHGRPLYPPLRRRLRPSGACDLGSLQISPGPQSRPRNAHSRADPNIFTLKERG